MAAKKRKRAPKGHPRGKTVHVAAYCRKAARKVGRALGYGKSSTGGDMPF